MKPDTRPSTPSRSTLESSRKKTGPKAGFHFRVAPITWREREPEQRRRREPEQRRRREPEREQQRRPGRREPEREQQLQERERERRLLLFCRKRSEKRRAERRAGQNISFRSSLTKLINMSKNQSVCGERADRPAEF
jgi:hypothetical protein